MTIGLMPAVPLYVTSVTMTRAEVVERLVREMPGTFQTTNSIEREAFQKIVTAETETQIPEMISWRSEVSVTQAFAGICLECVMGTNELSRLTVRRSLILLRQAWELDQNVPPMTDTRILAVRNSIMQTVVEAVPILIETFKTFVTKDQIETTLRKDLTDALSQVERPATRYFRVPVENERRKHVLDLFRKRMKTFLEEQLEQQRQFHKDVTQEVLSQEVRNMMLDEAIFHLFYEIQTATRDETLTLPNERALQEALEVTDCRILEIRERIRLPEPAIVAERKPQHPEIDPMVRETPLSDGTPVQTSTVWRIVRWLFVLLSCLIAVGVPIVMSVCRYRHKG